MPPRVVIFGTGSIGAVTAFLLSRAIPASDIVAICRSNFDKASKDGFIIHSTVWGDNQKFKPVVARSVEEAVTLSSLPFDYILVCSKALPTIPSTAELIRPLVSPTTAIVLIQNEIAIEEQYAQLFPRNPLLTTVAYLPATQSSPGTIYHKETALLHIGTYPASAPSSAKAAASAFASLINTGGGSTELHDDVQIERWSKLLVNASWNPICALSRSQDKQFLDSNPDALQFVKDVMLEIASIANACGYPTIDAELVNFQSRRASAGRLPGVEPSMMADALTGRNIEVEAIVGNVIKVAKEKGIQTPLLRTIHLLAVALDDSFTRSRRRSDGSINLT